MESVSFTDRHRREKEKRIISKRNESENGKEEEKGEGEKEKDKKRAAREDAKEKSGHHEQFLCNIPFVLTSLKHNGRKLCTHARHALLDVWDTHAHRIKPTCSSIRKKNHCHSSPLSMVLKYKENDVKKMKDKSLRAVRYVTDRRKFHLNLEYSSGMH